MAPIDTRNFGHVCGDATHGFLRLSYVPDTDRAVMCRGKVVRDSPVPLDAGGRAPCFDTSFFWHVSVLSEKENKIACLVSQKLMYSSAEHVHRIFLSNKFQAISEIGLLWASI